MLHKWTWLRRMGAPGTPWRRIKPHHCTISICQGSQSFQIAQQPIQNGMHGILVTSSCGSWLTRLLPRLGWVKLTLMSKNHDLFNRKTMEKQWKTMEKHLKSGMFHIYISLTQVIFQPPASHDRYENALPQCWSNGSHLSEHISSISSHSSASKTHTLSKITKNEQCCFCWDVHLAYSIASSGALSMDRQYLVLQQPWLSIH